MSLGDWLLSFFLIFLWVAWIWLVITVLIDIFRSDDLSGWGKAGWTLLVVFLTWIGVLMRTSAPSARPSESRPSTRSTLRSRPLTMPVRRCERYQK